MTHKCDICEKEFVSDSKLIAHKNRKFQCSKIKREPECKICNTTFPCIAKLERHEKSKKHINNYNQFITNNIINNVNNGTINNNYITVINSFIETNINVLKEKEDIINIYEDCPKLIKIWNNFEDEGDIYPNNLYYTYCIEYFIKILSRLNFNLAYTENHNCNFLSFLEVGRGLEYKILIVDQIMKTYEWNNITYIDFMEKFISLMENINNKFKNENFNKVLNYVLRYKNTYISDLFVTSKIEKNLLSNYIEFEKNKKESKLLEDEMTKKRKAFDRELQEIANVQTLQYRALLALQELNTKTIKN